MLAKLNVQATDAAYLEVVEHLAKVNAHFTLLYNTKNFSCDISKLSQITYNNFEISFVVFMPNITTNHAITYTNPNKSRTEPNNSTIVT